MKKFVLTSMTLFFVSYTCFAAPVPPSGTAHTHASSKASHTQKATPSHTAKKVAQSHSRSSNVKLAANTGKIQHTSHALKPKSTARTTHKTKSSPHHQRHAVPQVRPAVLDEADTTTSTETDTNAVSTESTPTAKPVSLFNWFSQKDDSNPKSSDNTTHTTWTQSIAQHLTSAAHKTVATLRYSAYKFGGNRFDPQHGVYMLDCSSYVDNILHQNSPKAYSVLAQWSGSYKPNSEHYYNFFNRLTPASGESYAWNKVENTKKLEAGDILVFRYKNAHGRSSGGHVMLVMDKPKAGNAEVLQVRVADSAETGHSADTRGNRASGIGIGTLLLRINPATGQPYAFAWRFGSPWNSRVNIAMGRPPTA